MPTIPTTLSQEIASKYSIISNSFKLDKIKNAEKDIYTNEPKDELNVIVGDDKVPETFIPQVKLERWSNETNFSVRLQHNEVGVEKVETIGDKIKWSKGNIDIEFYDYEEGEGGYKLVWFLKKKPKTNKVNFTIQSKGLDFFYQPELTPEEIAEGAIRPPEVVGSYAVYHQTKGGVVDKNGKDYKMGKAFHIFRPHLFDAVGKEAWGILHIENGIYSVEIPQDFLDTAVYPIKSNDTFGYTTVGGTQWGESYNWWDGSLFTSPSNVGSADSISFYLNYQAGSTVKYKGLIILHSDSSIITNGVGAEVSVPSGYAWRVSTFSTPPSLSASTEYLLAGIVGDVSGDALYYKYDTGSANQGHYGLVTGGYASPANPVTVSGHTTKKISIYATYTPSGGGTVVKDLISCGMIAFPR